MTKEGEVLNHPLTLIMKVKILMIKLFQFKYHYLSLDEYDLEPSDIVCDCTVPFIFMVERYVFEYIG